MPKPYTPEQHPFSDKELDFGKYVVTHRTLWARAVVFALYFITLVIVYVFALKWIVFLVGSFNTTAVENSITERYIPWEEVRANMRPVQPRINSIDAVASGRDGRIDVTAVISNPNKSWRVPQIKYQFQVDGKPQGVMSTFLLPYGSQRISDFNIETNSRNPIIRVDILEISWQRVRDTSPMSIVDGLELGKVVFRNNYDLDTFEARTTLVNNSGKSLWVVGLQAVAKRLGDIVGINYIAIEKVKFGQRYNVRFVWPNALSGVDEVEITPVVDVYNESIYMPLETNDFPIDPSGAGN